LSAIRFTLLGCFPLVMLTACSPAGSGFSSMTVNLAEAGGAKLSQCVAALASGHETEFAGSDGSIWIWVKGADEMLSHYCRKQRDGRVSAWDEASTSNGATHSLKFTSDDSPAVFQPIASSK